MKKSKKTAFLAVTCILGAGSLAGCSCSGDEHEHIFQDYVSDNNATCTKDGTKTAKCQICDVTNTIEDTGSKKEHNYESFVSNNDATCTADGTKTGTCTGCGATSTVADPNSKKGHSFTNYQVSTAATCYQNEVKTAKCDNCNETDTKETPNSATGAHSFTNYVSNNDATCTADGTETAHCSTPGCTAVDTRTATGSKLNHTFENYTSNNDATCTSDGTETSKCKDCDATDTRTAANSKLEHTFENYIYNNDATCTADGTETAKCKDCDATDTRTKANTKLGHDLVWTSDGNATCLTDGTKTGRCTRCEYVSEPVTDEGTATGHSFSDDYAYDTQNHWHPAICGHNDEKSGETPHSFNETVITEPTCTTAGTRTYTCYCGYEYTETIPALEHDFQNYVYNDDATCTEDGTETAQCTRCTATDTRTKPDTKLGHDVVWTSNGDATCTEDGTESGNCSRCDYTEGPRTAENSATGHSFSDGYAYDENEHWHPATCGHTEEKEGVEAHTFTSAVTKEPTEFEEGERTYTCECGYSYTEAISNADLIYCHEVTTDEHLRSAATCTAPATYYYSDYQGNNGTEYFEDGDPLGHNLSMDYQDGVIVLACDRCGFDSSEDYADLGDDELTRNNIADILLNNEYTIHLELDDKYQLVTCANGLTVQESGLLVDGERVPGRLDYSVFLPFGNRVVYYEYGSIDVNTFEKTVKQSELNYDTEILNNTKLNIREFIEFACLNYAYNSDSGLYEADFNGTTIGVEITNKVVSGCYADGQNILSAEPTVCYSNFDDILTFNNLYLEPNSVTLNKSNCPHEFYFYEANGSRENAVLYCPLCGFTTDVDYATTADDELSSAQIGNILLNTPFAVCESSDDGNGGKTYGDCYIFNNGASFTMQENIGSLIGYWCKTLSDNVLFVERLTDITSIRNGINDKADFYVSDMLKRPYEYYDIFTDFNIFNLVEADYAYDANLGKYVATLNDGKKVELAIESGALVDVRVVDGNKEYIKDDEYFGEISASEWEKIFTPIYEPEDNTDVDGTFSAFFREFGIVNGSMGWAEKTVTLEDVKEYTLAEQVGNYYNLCSFEYNGYSYIKFDFANNKVIEYTINPDNPAITKLVYTTPTIETTITTKADGTLTYTTVSRPNGNIKTTTDERVFNGTGTYATSRVENVIKENGTQVSITNYVRDDDANQLVKVKEVTYEYYINAIEVTTFNYTDKVEGNHEVDKVRDTYDLDMDYITNHVVSEWNSEKNELTPTFMDTLVYVDGTPDHYDHYENDPATNQWVLVGTYPADYFKN